MNVCVYLRPCQTATRYAGIGRYVRELTASLAEAFAVGDELTILYDSRLPVSHLTEHEALKTMTLHWVGVEFNQLSDPLQAVYLSSLVEALQCDWLVLTHLFDEHADQLIKAAQACRRTRCALIHYDLVPLVFSSQYLKSATYRSFYQARLALMRDVDLIASISEYSQDDLKRLQLPESVQLQVIGSGADFSEFHLPEAARDVDSQYLLCAPSGFDYRKHVEFLIEAYADLPKAMRDSYPLRLVGKVPSSREKSIRQLITRLGITAQVELLGFVDDLELVSLYQHATVFVFPSRYEGFGLPVLEAILCGTPAITSNQTSLPEVHGTPEALFDPDRLDSLTGLIKRMLEDTEFRRSIYLKQRAVADSHTWSRVSARLLEALRASTRSPASEREVEALPRPSEIVLKSAKSARLQAVTTQDAHRFAVLVAELDRQLRPIHRQRCIGSAKTFKWQIEGHLAGPYSLAQLNRESAHALLELHIPVSVQAHDGAQYHALPDQFHREYRHVPPVTRAGDGVHIRSRNVFPPIVSDFPDDSINVLHHVAWEESGFPYPWACEFNQSLDGISCLSDLVLKVLVDHGVEIPLAVSGCGVRAFDQIESAGARVPVKPQGVFRFLHVSSCFPRKGIDVLLNAFASAFQGGEAVELVIKTFENPHNSVASQVETLKAQHPQLPPIHIVMDEYSDGEMKALYQSADVLVSPSRAEGFGLPIFEAAEHGVASIVTAWGGPMDLCDAENSWLLDFEFTKADSHLPVYDSVWAEPDGAQLSDLLKDVVSMDLSIRQARAAKLKARVDQCSRWSHVMQRHLDFVNGLVQDSQHLRPRIGWISTYGERCGIATYTDALISHMRAPPAVVLCRRGTEPPKSESHDLTDVTVLPSWDDRGFDGVIEAVKQYDLQAIVIQFVYPFYDYDAFASLIAELSAMGCVLVLELHESEPPAYAESKHLKHLRDTLLLFDRILVHSVSAMNDLKAIGVTEHVSLFPHGVKVLSQDSLTQPPASVRQRLARARQDNRVQIIGSYGFFLPHKGFTDLIESVAALRAEGFALHLVLMTAEYPAPASRVAIEEARRLIEVLDLHSHVTLVTEFLADEDSSAALKACDVLVFPYRYTEQGASGAVRYGLACDVPVVTSDLPFFDELGASVRRIRAGNAEHMTQDLKACLLDVQNHTPEIQAQLDVARDWVRNHSYGVLAKRLYGMVTALTRLKLRTFDA